MMQKTRPILLVLILTLGQMGNTVFARDHQKSNQAVYYRIDSIVENAMQLRVFPGCQVLVWKDGKPLYEKCFGHFTYDSPQKVEPSTLYDLASLSKTTGTLLAVMKLYDNGRLKLTDKVSDYLALLRGTNKENITISELLYHESGLPAGLPFYELAMQKKSTLQLPALPGDTTCMVKLHSRTLEYKPDWVSKTPNIGFQTQVADSFFITGSFHAAAMQLIAKAPLKAKTYVYSCLNFILLKEIAESIAGEPIDQYLDKEFFQPMGLKNICYLPLRTHSKEEIAPTIQKDFLRNSVVQGFVHDPDAAFLGGVSGNAGLFATAQDVAAVHQMLLDGGKWNGKRYLSAETCQLFTTATSASGRRGLGFDKPVPGNEKANPCCPSAPATVYGHTGYTGTCCWVDPDNRLIFVFLSNRTYPNDDVNRLSKLHIRPKIQEVIYESMVKPLSEKKH